MDAVNNADTSTTPLAPLDVFDFELEYGDTIYTYTNTWARLTVGTTKYATYCIGVSSFTNLNTMIILNTHIHMWERPKVGYTKHATYSIG